MPWSANPATPSRRSGGKWSPNPVAPPRPTGGKWQWVPRSIALAQGLGESEADLVAHIAAIAQASGQGVGSVALSQIIAAVASGNGESVAILVTKFAAATLGRGESLAAARAGVAAAGNAQGNGAGLLAVRGVIGNVLAVGQSAATAVFSAHGDDVQNFAVGSYSYAIPGWSRFIDGILWPGGASGQTGSGAFNTAGKGGNAGTPVSFTLVRGVDIAWSLATITGTAGAGGAQAPNSDNGGPNAGADTTANYQNLSGTAVTQKATGATGTTSTQNGATGPTVTVGANSYPSGAGGTGNAGAGSAPGGGGAGGNGGVFGSRTRGGPGGGGRATFRARQ